MPKHTLYVARGSAPCRAVLYLLSRIGVRQPGELEAYAIGDLGTIEVVEVDVSDGSHVEVLAPINPLHCVPTLATPHGPIWESRAVMQYLAELAQTVNPDAWTFYPRKLYHRATVNRLLDWDQGTFYKAVGGAVYPLVFQGQEPTDEQLSALAGVVRHIDEVELADGRPYLTGNDATIADFSIAMGMSMLRLAELGMDDVPRCEAWLARMAESPGWAEANVPFEGWVAQVKADREEAKADSEVPAESTADAEEPAEDPKADDEAASEEADTAPAEAS
jgi:glutathione S-transferase